MNTTAKSAPGISVSILAKEGKMTEFRFDHPLIPEQTRKELKADYQRWLELTKDWTEADRKRMEEFFEAAYAKLG